MRLESNDNKGVETDCMGKANTNTSVLKNTFTRWITVTFEDCKILGTCRIVCRGCRLLRIGRARALSCNGENGGGRSRAPLMPLIAVHFFAVANLVPNGPRTDILIFGMIELRFCFAASNATTRACARFERFCFRFSAVDHGRPFLLVRRPEETPFDRQETSRSRISSVSLYLLR